MAIWEGRGSLWRKVVASKNGKELGGGGWWGWTSKLGRGVVCGEVFAWAGRILARIVSLLLGWGIE